MINLTRLNNIMSLQYVNVIFTIKIEHQIKFLTYPVFIFRSVIGKELHLMACLFRNRTCEECPLKFTCPYSFLFETHVLKDNDIIKGRNKASHPFVLSSSAKYGEIRDNLDLNVTLFGKGIKYLPYFYYAIKRAGEKGIFKERVKYSILDAKVNNKSIIKKEPSAELKPNQKDQDTLPPYEILDRIIDLYIVHNKSEKEIESAGFERQLVYRIIDMIISYVKTKNKKQEEQKYTIIFHVFFI